MPPDFSRDVHCLLGLPFDPINMANAVSQIQIAAATRTPCFLSTPNLNFLIAAHSDPAFRNSVINSDLSIADGMPLVWISRLLGIPIRERVAGSALFEELRKATAKTVSVFFFGGPDGAGEAACARLNAENKGLSCVGFESPGFCSIEEMSSEVVIRKINSSNADFLVVSLGAKKGQAWIERNRKQITVPIVSHLGAVLNFVAGTVKRAPVWMQKSGLEWLWRIKEDPALWRRYLSDGAKFFSLLMFRVVPHAYLIYHDKPASHEFASSLVSMEENEGEVVIRLGGAWGGSNLDPLRACFADVSKTEGNVRIIMGEVPSVDSAFVGLLMLLYGDRQQRGKKLSVSCCSNKVRRILHYSCVEFLLDSQ